MAPNPAPKAQQNAPAEKIAPRGRVAPDKGAQAKPSRPQTTGQAQPRTEEPQHSEAPKADQPHKNSNAMQKPDHVAPTAQPNARRDHQQQPSAALKSDKNATTTGQATRPVAGSVTLNTEQKTKLRTTVVAKAQKVNNVNFSIHVGTVVPRRVHLVAVSPELIEIHPAWRGYLYFVVRDEIIIVEPRTLKIVAVLEV